MENTTQQNEVSDVSTRFKAALMVVMLSRPEGATLSELTKHLGWKENSVRGAISLYAKNHPEYTLVSEKVQGLRTYYLKKVFND